MEGRLTRREAIAAAAGGAAAGMLAPLGWLGHGLRDALAATPAPKCGAKLSDIEHVVIFTQENRSFDHFFGSYRGVRGFADPKPLELTDGSGLPVFAQPGYPAAGFGGHLYPFRLDVSRNGACVHDIIHTWGPQHRSWNGGRMDGFLREHLRDEGQNGTVTMGYHTRADIPYYYALADHFTICDNYHCALIGPSDPNHVHIASATIDPDGRAGGPLVANRTSSTPTLSWTTMPEQLRAHGISWKVYSPDTRNVPLITDSPFTMFKQFYSDPELNARGLQPRFPADFQHDVNAGELPQVSWVYGQIQFTDHPPFPPDASQAELDGILRSLAANPSVWSKTVLFVTWDENGAFFDHVAPPTPPPGTKGEWLTVNPLPEDAEGIAGPVGLGFRVPLLVISPFTRGGLVCSERFDHTSLLRFLEKRFGAEVPNLSAWRRSVTGDLTSAFNFAAAPDARLPSLPAITTGQQETPDCASELAEKLTSAPVAPVYPVPPNRMPGQERGSPRRPAACATSKRHKPAHRKRKRPRSRRRRRR
jgi:phospholipase C